MRYLGLLLTAALAGCSGSGVNRVDPPTQALFDSTDVVLTIPQPQLFAEDKNGGQVFTSSPASGNVAADVAFMILAAAIDGAIAGAAESNRERALGPLTRDLTSVDVDEAMRASVGRAFAEVKWLHARPPAVTKTLSTDSGKATLAQSDASAVLFLVLSYYLEQDYSIVHVDCTAILMPRKSELVAKEVRDQTVADRAASLFGKDSGLYKTKVAYEARLPVPLFNNHPGNAALWHEHDGDRLKRALSFGIEEVARDAAFAFESLASDSTDPMRAGPVRSEPTGTLFRGKTGSFKYVAKVDALPAPVLPASAGHPFESGL